MVTVVNSFKEKIEQLAKGIFAEHKNAKEGGLEECFTLISNGTFMGNFGYRYDDSDELVIESNVIKGSKEDTIISVQFKEPKFTEEDYFEYLFFLLTNEKYSYTQYALEDTVWFNDNTYLGASDVVVSLRLLFNKIGILSASGRSNGTTIRLNNFILGEGELDITITKVSPHSIAILGHRSLYNASARSLRAVAIEPMELWLHSRDYPQKLYELVYGGRDFNDVNFKASKGDTE